MKLVRYGQPGAERPAILDAQGVLRDLSSIVSDIAGAALLPENLARIRAVDPAVLPAVEGTPRIGACVGQVGKFVCVGLNYTDHAAESGMAIPDEPVLFMKPPNCIVGPYDTVEIPRGSTKTDWEVELGIVIGKPAKYVSVEDAYAHVAGYCVVNDVSEREYQIERGGTWDKGKGFDTFGPVGPWLVTTDEIRDPQRLGMWLDVNGVRRQTGNTSTMIFNVAFLVHYMSQFATLRPGDLVTTGTPPGVGMGHKPPLYLKPGDVMRLGIDGLGEQTQEVVAYDTHWLD